MALVEADGCIFDEQQLVLSRGFESLDPIAREAFVNHVHIGGKDREAVADLVVRSWVAEMRSRWPDRAFRIYRHSDSSEVVVRFHMVRCDLLNWSEDVEDVIEID
jgi:hypothetical protein